MNHSKKSKDKTAKQNIWARPEMEITFRAEIMPGKNRDERTFRVEKVLSNERVTLHDFMGEHRQSSFEAVNFEKGKNL